MNTRINTVLLVDDDPDLLRLLSMRLQSVGYTVQTTASGEEALTKIAITRPHAVITDLRMPGMDGLTLFDRIHNQHPTLPVIVLTAHGTIPDAVQATQRGVFGYLTKPVEARELLSLLARALSLSPEESATESTRDASWCAEIVTANPSMETLLAEAKLVADSNASVLIQGESGTGKELLAKAIHLASPRATHPFVAINCAAIPEQLLESELFGHARGAFTGAVSAHKGLFQIASGGTVLLDEIGDMPLALQSKLLRVLQDQEIRPIGSTQSVRVDVRIISATHQVLEQAVAENQFREDLYYRLNVVSLNMPPLRDRREDIPLLAHHFLKTLHEKHRHSVNGFTPEAMEALIAYEWPGNVRHLFNTVEQCCVLCTAPLIPASLVIRALREKPVEILTYSEAKQHFEREYLIQLLKLTNGQITEAARLAGRNRTEFYRLLQRNHLTPAMFKNNE
ncbi:MAG: sigma 54-interacting transcriptional regulator [Gammaproteobacteria bacterium]|nr:sigma 54-interacting transcriptional regulator [Gammaproteobacteria bacterium]